MLNIVGALDKGPPISSIIGVSSDLGSPYFLALLFFAQPYMICGRILEDVA